MSTHPPQKAKKLARLLALLEIPGVGERTLAHVYQQGLLDTLWETQPGDLGKQCQELGLSQRQSQAFAEYLRHRREEIERIGKRKAEEILSAGIQFIPFDDQQYPQALRSLEAPPLWLFLKGDESLLNQLMIAIVGTRSPDATGLQIAYRLGARLSQYNVAILSGMARGIDTAAHKGAIAGFGKTVAILGQGLRLGHENTLGEAILKSGGALVSSFLPNTRPSRTRYLQRNTLIAAMSLAIIPVQIQGPSSGTGATIRRARALGKPVLGLYNSRAVHSQLNATTAKVLRAMDVPLVDIWEGWEGIIKALREHTNHPWQMDNAAQQEAWLVSLRERLRREIEWFGLSSRQWETFCNSVIRENEKS